MRAKFYDPLTERWYNMPATPVIERPKLPTEERKLSEKTAQKLRIAAHHHVWEAVEATATASQMSVDKKTD